MGDTDYCNLLLKIEKIIESSTTNLSNTWWPHLLNITKLFWKSWNKVGPNSSRFVSPRYRGNTQAIVDILHHLVDPTIGWSQLHRFTSWDIGFEALCHSTVIKEIYRCWFDVDCLCCTYVILCTCLFPRLRFNLLIPGRGGRNKLELPALSKSCEASRKTTSWHSQSLEKIWTWREPSSPNMDCHIASSLHTFGMHNVNICLLIVFKDCHVLK